MIIYWSIKCSNNNSIDQSINQFIIDQTMFNKSLNLSINHSITCWINQWVDSPINLSVNQLINYSFKWPNNQSVDQSIPQCFVGFTGRVQTGGNTPLQLAVSLALAAVQRGGLTVYICISYSSAWQIFLFYFFTSWFSI